MKIVSHSISAYEAKLTLGNSECLQRHCIFKSVTKAYRTYVNGYTIMYIVQYLSLRRTVIFLYSTD